MRDNDKIELDTGGGPRPSSPSTKAALDGDIHIGSRQMSMRKFSEVIVNNDRHYIKTYFFGIFIAALTIVIFCIMFVYLNAHYCQSKTGLIRDNHIEYKLYSSDHFMVALVSFYQNLAVSIPICWFLPSVICLDQIHWNRMRILGLLYLLPIIFTITYFLYHYFGHIQGAYLMVSWSVYISYFIIIGILYGYPAFRAVAPFVYAGTLIVFTFGVVYSLVFKNMSNQLFSYLYPWYLCTFESLALFIIDGFMTLPSKQSLQKLFANGQTTQLQRNTTTTSKTGRNYKKCIFSCSCIKCCIPWFCCCHNEPCLTEIHSRQTRAETTKVETVDDLRQNREKAKSAHSRVESTSVDLSMRIKMSDLSLVKVVQTHQHCYKLKLFISKFRMQIQRSPSTNKQVNLDVKDVTNNLYSSQLLFFWNSLLVVIVESYRLTGILRVATKIEYVFVSLVINILSEVFSRNNLYYETFYRLILKKANPKLSKCYSIYYGVKFQIEYLPLIIVIILNLFSCGPSNYCYQSNIASNIDFKLIPIGWWIVLIYFFGEVITDILSPLVLKLLVDKLQWIDKNSDAHSITFVKLYYFETGVIFMCLGIFVWNAFLYDCATRCTY